MRAAAGVTLSLLLAAALGGCGLSNRNRPPVGRAQDERIRREVEARLAAEPTLAAASLRVAVHAGTVSLYGSVRGLGALQCALTNATLVDGVRTVADHLVLQSGPREVRCLAPRG